MSLVKFVSKQKTMNNLKTKITLVAAVFMLTIVGVNAQINLPKNNTIKTKPRVLKPVFPKMDATIKEIIDGANEGTYQFNMASLTLGKYHNTNRFYVGSMSTSSASNKYYSLTKSDELTARCLFREKNTGRNDVPIFFIYTTKLGGKYIKIKHKSSDEFRKLKNIKIAKKGEHRFIITADYEKNGTITNYIFNIYRYVIQ